MKKILSAALILTATAIMACPMQGSNSPMGGMGCKGMMEKCSCDTKKLPPMMEKLDLNDQQKEQIMALREEGKAFHNKQREKMMAILTPEQRGKLEGMRMMMGQNGPKGYNTPQNPPMEEKGMGCKNCNTAQ